jgi:hypothetical protein
MHSKVVKSLIPLLTGAIINKAQMNPQANE